jgi:osmoprotectant transport system permease protein
VSSFKAGLVVLQSDLGPKTLDWNWISNNLSDEIIPAVIGHVYLSFVSVAIALAISLPTGVLVSRYRKAYPPVTFVTGLLFSIPSLAAFALLVAVPGIGLGPRAVIIALVAYSLLVLIRNVVAGMDSVAEETKDAARGMGLTPRQVLFKVELPLALPVIVAGVRIATVTVIGIATIGAYISGGGLGELIFTGISRNFPTRVIVGALLATLMAITADLALLWLERLLRPWARVKRA